MMGLSAAEISSVKITSFFSVFSCVYICVLCVLLLYKDLLYELGKCTSWPVILGVVVAEFCKFVLLTTLKQTNVKDSKPIKVKKGYLNYKVNSFAKSVVVTFAVIIICYSVAILFGAPVFQEREETLMFSLMVTALIVFPMCLNVGPDMAISLLSGSSLLQGNLVGDLLKYNFYFTVAGAWFGAMVIPLDWDRPWQVWPIPCCLGAFAGYFCSHIINLIKLLPIFTKNFTRKTGKYGL